MHWLTLCEMTLSGRKNVTGRLPQMRNKLMVIKLWQKLRLMPIMLSVLLTAFVSPLFIWFTVFIGLNLIQSSFTGFCPAASVFRKLGIKSGCAFN